MDHNVFFIKISLDFAPLTVSYGHKRTCLLIIFLNNIFQLGTMFASTLSRQNMDIACLPFL